MDMPKNVDIAINLLQAPGVEAYAVGGCVRDSLLGKTPNDWDIRVCRLSLHRHGHKARHCDGSYRRRAA